MPTRRDLKTFGLGFSAAVLVGSMWPGVKDGLRPATKAMLRGAMVASDKVRTMSAEFQTEMEDLVAEVQFEKVQHSNGTYHTDPKEEGSSVDDTGYQS